MSMAVSNKLYRAHVAGFKKAVREIRTSPLTGRLHEEINQQFADNLRADSAQELRADSAQELRADSAQELNTADEQDALSLAVRAAIEQIAAAAPVLSTQQASKYQNWLLTRYRQNWLMQTGDNPPQALLLEDLSKYAEDLALYHGTSDTIKARAGIKRDIFKIDGPFDLAKQLKALRGESKSEFKPLTATQQAFIANNEAIIIEQTARWRLVMPLTVTASQEFGSGTRWCTAAQNDNRFNSYFPDNALLYLEASGPDGIGGKTAFVMNNGKIKTMYNADDESQKKEQQQALIHALPGLENCLSNLAAHTDKLASIIDKVSAHNAIKYTRALFHLAPEATFDETALVRKIKSGNFNSGELNHALLLAADYNLSQAISELLAKGADANYENSHALRVQAARGQSKVVRQLIEAGADVHSNNNIALCFAAAYGRAEVVRLLLEAGADVYDGNSQPLINARMGRHTDVVNILEAHIAKLNTQRRPTPSTPVKTLQPSL